MEAVMFVLGGKGQVIAEVTKSLRAKHYVDVKTNGEYVASFWGPTIKIRYASEGGNSWWILYPHKDVGAFFVHVDRVVKKGGK